MKCFTIHYKSITKLGNKTYLTDVMFQMSKFKNVCLNFKHELLTSHFRDLAKHECKVKCLKITKLF